MARSVDGNRCGWCHGQSRRVGIGMEIGLRLGEWRGALCSRIGMARIKGREFGRCSGFGRCRILTEFIVANAD